jgi:hypothetical protein
MWKGKCSILFAKAVIEKEVYYGRGKEEKLGMDGVPEQGL